MQFIHDLEEVVVFLHHLDKIDFESSVEYGGESLFGDDFRHRDRKNFKEILKDVKVPKCGSCNEMNCLIENERF